MISKYIFRLFKIFHLIPSLDQVHETKKEALSNLPLKNKPRKKGKKGKKKVKINLNVVVV